jgi:hypothetical protein
MKRTIVLTMTMLLSVPALAANPIIYPAEGQDKAQQSSDEGECFIWARDNTGFDPLAPPSTQVAAAEQQSGRALRGAAGGAAIGAIVGDSDDAAKGAAIGAVVGRSRQNRQNRAAQEAAQSASASAQASASASRAEYDRAYGACLEGRGYTVK